MSRPRRDNHSRPHSRIQWGLQERASWWDRLLDRPLLWALLAVVVCTWLLTPRAVHHLPEWSAGEVATFDVTVPRDLSLPDEAATEAVREEARAQVLPVYDLEPRVPQELIGGVRALFESCRERQAAGETLDEEWAAAATDLVVDDSMLRVLRAAECDEGLERALVDVVGQLYRLRVVDDQRALERSGERGVTVRNLLTDSERTLTLADLTEAVDLRTGVEPTVRTHLLEQEAVARRWIKPTVDFLDANVAPNLIANRAETAARVRAAAEGVTPRSQLLQRGQVLVRRGDAVTPTIARTLRVLNERRQELTAVTTVFGIAALVAILVAGLWRLLGRLVGTADLHSRLSVILLLTTVFVAVDRLGLFLATAVSRSAQGAVLSNVDVYLWGLPHAAGAVTVAMLLGPQPAILFAVCEALLAGVMLGGDFAVVVYALASGVVGTVAVQQLKGRTVLTRIGALVGLANVLLLVSVQLYRGWPDAPAILLAEAFFAFVGGPVSLAAASFLLPALEGLFGITTDTRLLELSNQNLPLLKRLSLQAPGTYQHSLAVGNLAEAGAEAVGANGLLLRVCAYYHDIGKLVKPDYFVENQRGANPHDTLSPSMSALVIQSHVKEGLAIARREKLPLPLRQAIATHHGNKLIRYFFNRATELQDPGLGEVRESDYRYPGPRPHTKELGILLLADAVEAAARTLENPSPSKIQSMIDRIFTDAVEDGQLDDTDLTFAELDKAASAFLWVLTNMYHHRIDYPGFEFNRRRARRDSGAVQVGAKTLATSR